MALQKQAKNYPTVESTAIISETEKICIPIEDRKNQKEESVSEDSDIRFSHTTLFVMRIDFLRLKVVNITDSTFF